MMMKTKLELVAYAVTQIEEVSRAKMACGEGRYITVYRGDSGQIRIHEVLSDACVQVTELPLGGREPDFKSAKEAAEQAIARYIEGWPEEAYIEALNEGKSIFIHYGHHADQVWMSDGVIQAHCLADQDVSVWDDSDLWVAFALAKRVVV